MSEIIWRQIKEESRRLKRQLALRTNSLPTPAELSRLADLWEQYVATLPLPSRRQALAIIGYPRVVQLTEIPDLIRRDPYFATLIVRFYGR